MNNYNHLSPEESGKRALTPLTLNLSVFMDKVANLVIKKDRSIFWLMSIFILLALFGLKNLTVNFLPNEEFTKDFPLQKTLDYLAKRVTVGGEVIYVFDAGKRNGVQNPDFLQEIDTFQTWLREQEHVLNVFSYVDALKQMNASLHNDNIEQKVLPNSEAMIAQYMMMFNLFSSTDYSSMGLTNDLAQLKLSAYLTPKLNHLKIKVLENKMESWLVNNTSLNVSARSGVIENPYINSKAFWDLIEGAFYALLAISLVLMIAFGSFKYGMISIVPNLFPALMVFGLWGYLVGYVAFVEACIFSLTIGIVVDDTVHFVSKYLSYRKLGSSYEEAIKKTFETVGAALIITTFSFAVGLLILNFSYFQQLSLISRLMVPILVMALVLDFFYLPSLLLRMEKLFKPEFKIYN